MSLFSSSSRQAPQASKSHPHGVGDRCPTCEQPIGQDIARQIEARQRQQQEEALQQARAEAEAAAAKRIATERQAIQAQAEQASLAKLADIRAELARVEEARTAAHEQMALLQADHEKRIAAERQAIQAQVEQAALAKLADMQAELARAQQARTAADAQIAALKAEQDAAIEKRMAEIQENVLRQKEDMQREKETLVLAEKAKVIKLQSELADMQRKLEGKSANELGEGSEVDLFEQLRATFEGDRITRVGKGVNGADVIHEVMHNGKMCGRIVYDAKNRNAWQNEFVSKLRADKIAHNADHAILSSNKFPKDKAQVHYQDGVVVALPARVVAIVQLLRDQVVRMHELRISKEGREQKSMEIYAFITSEHCKQLLDQVETQAGRMLDLDTKEQEAHRRLWDARKKLITSVLKARSDLGFEIDRIIGTAGNGHDVGVELGLDDDAAA